VITEGMSGAFYTKVEKETYVSEDYDPLDAPSYTITSLKKAGETGDTFILYFLHVVDATDVAEGGITNVVTSPGTPPPPEIENPVGAFTLDKIALSPFAGGEVAYEGDKVWYEITVENTGVIDLTNIVVTEGMSGTFYKAKNDIQANRLADAPDYTITKLEVGEKLVIYFLHVVDIGDVDEGGIKNVVTSPGTPPPPEIENPVGAFTLDKVAMDPFASGEVAFEGDKVWYEITVENTGEIDLEDIVVTESMSGAFYKAKNDTQTNWLADAPEYTLVSLKKGETEVIYFLHIVDIGDVDEGGITNVVTSPGTPPPPEIENPVGAFTLDKVSLAPFAEGEVAFEGDKVWYEITVENTGEIDLEDIVVTEGMSGAFYKAKNDIQTNWLADAPEYTIESLEKGEIVVIYFLHVVDADDVAAGGISNVVTSPGTPPPPEIENPVGAFTLDKVAMAPFAGGEVAYEGDEVWYKITVVNTGEIDLEDIEVTEGMDGAFYRVQEDGVAYWLADAPAYTITSLKKGETLIIYFLHIVDADDVAVGGIKNVVTAPGTPEPPEIENPIGDLMISKSIAEPFDAEDTIAYLGNEIVFEITIENIGQADLFNIKIVESLSGRFYLNGVLVATGNTYVYPGPINIGDDAVTISFHYIVAARDVEAGFVANTVTAGNKGAETPGVDTGIMVAFNTNGGTTGPTPGSKTVIYGKQYGSLSTTGRTGYTFAGWWTAPVGGTQVLNTTIVRNAAGHTLYAHWTPNTYVVSYNANGGTGAMANQTATYDQDLATSPNAFARAGYTFVGWNAETDGSGAGYANRVVFSPWLTTGDLTLYAQWTPTPPPPDPPITLFTVRYVPGEFGTFTTQTYGGLAPGSLTPAFRGTPTGQTGYTFNGWTPIVSRTVRSSVTYVAQWTAPPVTPVVNVEPPATIEEMPTPQAPPTQIEAEPVPLVTMGSWALFNLMLTILTGLVMVALFVTYFVKRRDEGKEREDDPDAEKKVVSKNLLARLVTIATTLIAIILFILTQDMNLPMILADKYSVWHIVIAAVTVAFAFLSKKYYDDEEIIEDHA
jgi:uncharacterized repeat protein (TIGR02543 family)